MSARTPSRQTDSAEPSSSVGAALPARTHTRSGKERHIGEFMQLKRLQSLSLADYVERHPESLQTALEHVEKFLDRPSHVRIHWILKEWRSVLLNASPFQMAAILRDDMPATESLRESPPYLGPT